MYQSQSTVVIDCRIAHDYLFQDDALMTKEMVMKGKFRGGFLIF